MPNDKFWWLWLAGIAVSVLGLSSLVLGALIADMNFMAIGFIILLVGIAALFVWRWLNYPDPDSTEIRGVSEPHRVDSDFAHLASGVPEPPSPSTAQSPAVVVKPTNWTGIVFLVFFLAFLLLAGWYWLHLQNDCIKPSQLGLGEDWQFWKYRCP